MLANQLEKFIQLDSENIDNNQFKITTYFPPGKHFVTSLNAVWMIQQCLVPLHYDFPFNEVEYRVQDSNSKIFLTTKGQSNLSSQQLDQLKQENPGLKVLYIEDLEEESQCDKLTIDNENLFLQDSNYNQEQDALIIYTSGTTGKPKGAVHTQKSLNHQINMLINNWKWTQNDHILNVLPLHHIHGLINVLLCSQVAGACNEFLPFSAEQVWKRIISDHSITLFMAVPTIYVKLIQQFKSQDEEMQNKMTEAAKRLRLFVSGSAALPPEIFTEFQKISGHWLLERFGMTEFGMAISNNYDNPKMRQIGSVGVPFGGIEAKVVDPSTQQVCDDEQSGDLLVKSPSMFKEYLNLPEKTAQEFTTDGFFKTGDTAMIKNGLFYIQGRTSVDIIKTSGYKISALEIENVLLKFRDIKEVAVLGLEDPVYGQVIAAVIATNKNFQFGEQREKYDLELKQFCKEQMSSYKVPRIIKHVKQIPRNQMQKINKKQLIEELFPK